jgi:hypothetical protein
VEVFGGQFADHARRGRCVRCSAAPVLPTTRQENYLLAA